MNRNLLMILGVVEIEEDVRALGAYPLEYNRTPDYKEILGNIFKGLQYIHRTKEPVLLVASSGTGVMEGAVTNVMNSSSEALFVNGGVFGKVQEIARTKGTTISCSNLFFNTPVRAKFLRKAKTEEGMEAVGRGELAKAYAVVLID